jgi:hypothetical protein
MMIRWTEDGFRIAVLDDGTEIVVGRINVKKE